ncbi:MAG TPA: DUF2062 domain-containing protein [Bryobacteraceae bacterium]|nr:DUF2062 domain-containing protein [Bryobacteraceae bacterium]
MKTWIHRKLVSPFVELLKQGVSPEKIALTVALGVSLGTVPVLGSTSVLCTLAALRLRLNLAAILAVNWVVYPLQIALLIPFLRAGAWLFRVEGPKLTVVQIFGMIRASIWHTITALWTATMHALVVWAITGAIATVVVYLMAVVLLKSFWKRPSVIN